MKVIKLYKDNCVPCTQVTDFLNRENIVHESLDAFNEGAEIAAQQNIMGVPHLMLYDNDGNLILSVNGFNIKKLTEFKNIYNELLGKDV